MGYKKKVNNYDLTPGEILTWLNGRAVGSIIVTDGILWTQREAINEGLTIEDAVLRFVTRNNIDVRKEIAGE
jgi:hypothetical protein